MVKRHGTARAYIILILALIPAACVRAPAVTPTIEYLRLPTPTSPAPSPTTQPTPAPSPAPPLVPTLPPTATLAQAYPLALGAQWVYSITTLTGTPAHLITMTGYLTQTVVDASQQNGMRVYRIFSEQDATLADFPHNEPIQYYALTADAAYWWDGDHPEPLIDSRGGEGALVLPWPLKVGQQFNPIGVRPRNDSMYVWNVLAQAAVTTPAGHFEGCYNLVFTTNPDDNHDWFCPGTGFVQREYHHHGSIGNLTQELVSHQVVTVADHHAADAAIKAARLRLSQNGHANPALASVVSITPTTWTDDCLGLPSNVACRLKQMPGYQIELEKDGQRYLVHTDAAGNLARLAWSSVLPLSDTFIQWRNIDGTRCKIALIGSQQIQSGFCGEALVSETQSGMSSANYGLVHASALKEKYRSFTANTAQGTLIFTGTGSVAASPAEQRAVAEWAALRYMEAGGGYLSADAGLALVWHEKSAIACGTLWVYRDGLAVAWDCSGSNVVGSHFLAPDDLARFYTWLDSGKQWEIEHIPQTGDGQPDASVILPWNAGDASASGRSVVHADDEGLLTFARVIYTCLSAACPVRVQGRLTLADGRIFTYRMLAPADWAGKFEVRDVGGAAFFDFNASQKSWLFAISAVTEAQWQAAQKWPDPGEELLSKDGVIFTWNHDLANQYTGSEADDFQRMASQERAVVASLQVATAGMSPPESPDVTFARVETATSTSPDGFWTVRSFAGFPAEDKGDGRYYTQLRVTSTEGTVRMVVDTWTPLGLGYTVPMPLRWGDNGFLYFTNRPVPDGCAVFVNGSDLLKLDLAFGTVTQVMPALGQWLALSPDEQTLAYQGTGDRGLLLRDLTTGAERKVPLSVGTEYQAGAFVWSPDSDTLMLTLAIRPCLGRAGPLAGAESTSIVRVDAITGKPTVLIREDARRLVTTGWPTATRVTLTDSRGRQLQMDPTTGQVTTK